MTKGAAGRLLRAKLLASLSTHAPCRASRNRGGKRGVSSPTFLLKCAPGILSPGVSHSTSFRTGYATKNRTPRSKWRSGLDG